MTPGEAARRHAVGKRFVSPTTADLDVVSSETSRRRGVAARRVSARGDHTPPTVLSPDDMT